MDTTISSVLDYVINRTFAEYTENGAKAMDEAMECSVNNELKAGAGRGANARQGGGLK
jgi:hypothetical protein